MTIANRRNKLYESAGIPFFSWVAEDDFFKPTFHSNYYTQLEFAAGIRYGFRIGFNIGETLDFILGWTTIDILKDDIGIID